MLALAALLVMAAAGADAADVGRTTAAAPEPPPPSPGHPGIAPMPRPEETLPPLPPHRAGELECTNCHQSKHHGVLQMYLGRGGRGARAIPSHMAQLRLECIACHVQAKEAEATAAIVGQTWRPSETACLGCHGERYRGMVAQWADTLGKMRSIVSAKVTTARAALLASRTHARRAHAQKLTEDAEYNARFVQLGHGVHNVFYAADLLRLSSGWLDEATRVLGKAPAKTDDALVRGGYCAVLCHEPAGVKTPEVAKYGTRSFPHARHAKEFGATCTACHSAEQHKAFAATPATCTGCHHGPQNERCESCHKAQATFYRGQAKAPVPIAANVMADAVGCTGCHDLTKRQTVATITQKCLACHEPAYTAIVPEWTTGFAKDVKKTSEAIRTAEAALARAQKNGRRVPEAQALVKDARAALTLVQTSGPPHNPLAADALLSGARQKAEEARTKASGR
jgi:hypothetical protein